MSILRNYFKQYHDAHDPNSPPEVLEKLANDRDWRVRQEVANNPNTPPEVLEMLASDGNIWVRCRVAYNPNTPKYFKTYLRYKNYLKFYEQI